MLVKRGNPHLAVAIFQARQEAAERLIHNHEALVGGGERRQATAVRRFVLGMTAQSG